MEGEPLNLDELALKYGTDKGPTDHDYTPFYEQYFFTMRYQPITLLELGIWRGASLRMWREYFPNAKIVGLDRLKVAEIAGLRIERQIVGEQDDPRLIEALGNQHGPFDVIIDDCSHISSKTIASFQLLWPHLKDGGLYVIEDLQTAYDSKHYGWPEGKENPDSWGGHDRTAMEWCKRLADEVNRGLYPDKYRLGYDVSSVQFFPNICFIRKAR